MRHQTKVDFGQPTNPETSVRVGLGISGPGLPDAQRPVGVDFPSYLVQFTGLSARDLGRALEISEACGAPLDEVLRAYGFLSAHEIARARIGFAGLGFVSLSSMPPDPRLTGLMEPAECLALSVLPWRVMGGLTWIAVPDRAIFETHRDMLRSRFGPVAPVGCDLAALQAAIAQQAGPILLERAENRPEPILSVRSWPEIVSGLQIWVLAPLLCACVILFPAVALGALLVWVIGTLAASTILRALALLNTDLPSAAPQAGGQGLPVISLLVPMYNEPDIAPRLLRRLERLDYPRALLDLVLVLEHDDVATRDALTSACLPPWIRIVVVPPGNLRTKPRAMNYALDFCRGSIIGIYDAEDAPEPGQLRAVAAHFASAPPQVACLQGALDYYNPHTNWLARCFTVEYAAWFRVMMPAMQRLGFPMPLGGTTLFIKREVLERLGAWDAHNVTEDADLGVRLARAGYVTQMLASATEEEANCRLKPWLRQRSRWIKGHLLTWAVHMRNPLRLWRDLGPKGFLGYQVVFLGAQSQVLLAPFMWSFWLAFAGLPHPVSALLPAGAMMAMFGLFLLAEALAICVGVVGVRRTRHLGLGRWVPSLHLYHPLAAVAGWRAVWESFTQPFYWAKTSHGHFDTVSIAVPSPVAVAQPQGQGAARPVARVMLFRRAELVAGPRVLRPDRGLDPKAHLPGAGRSAEGPQAPDLSALRMSQRGRALLRSSQPPRAGGPGPPGLLG